MLGRNLKKSKVNFYVIQDDLERYFMGFHNGSIRFSHHLDDAKFYDDKIKVRSVLACHEYFNCCEVIVL